MSLCLTGCKTKDMELIELKVTTSKLHEETEKARHDYEEHHPEDESHEMTNDKYK